MIGKVPKNTDVDFLCALALADEPRSMYGRPEERDRINELRRGLKAVLTAYRKTLKPRRRT